MSASGSRSFQVHACLGKGGFGEVYKATMVQASGVRREVVLKVLRPGLDPAGQAVERLRDEGRLLATLQHPVIMRAFDVTELQGRVALVAEYIDGQDLGETFGGDAPIPPRGLVQAIGAVSGALQAAWNAPGEGGQPMRLVHRDIKPSNIRIGRHGEVKLLDFGIAKADAMGREAQTATNMMIGSIGYMAPERFMSSDVHPASDVFALGVCMYEGLARKGLFRHLTPPMAARLSLSLIHI